MTVFERFDDENWNWDAYLWRWYQFMHRRLTHVKMLIFRYAGKMVVKDHLDNLLIMLEWTRFGVLGV